MRPTSATPCIGTPCSGASPQYEIMRASAALHCIAPRFSHRGPPTARDGVSPRAFAKHLHKKTAGCVKWPAAFREFCSAPPKCIWMPHARNEPRLPSTCDLIRQAVPLSVEQLLQALRELPTQPCHFALPVDALHDLLRTLPPKLGRLQPGYDNRRFSPHAVAKPRHGRLVEHQAAGKGIIANKPQHRTSCAWALRTRRKPRKCAKRILPRFSPRRTQVRAAPAKATLTPSVDQLQYDHCLTAEQRRGAAEALLPSDVTAGWIQLFLSCPPTGGRSLCWDLAGQGSRIGSQSGRLGVHFLFF